MQTGGLFYKHIREVEGGLFRTTSASGHMRTWTPTSFPKSLFSASIAVSTTVEAEKRDPGNEVAEVAWTRDQ